MPLSARQTALHILNTLEKSPRHLDAVLTQKAFYDEPMPKRDQNLVNALVFGVLRWKKLLDWILLRHSNMRIEKIDPHILNILRMGLFQIYFLDRIPCSAAVNTSVDLAKKTAPAWICGFVNAVLRKAAKNKDTLVYPDVNADPHHALPIIESFPNWLTDRWIARFGAHEALQLCRACNAIPKITVRTNTLKTTRDQLLMFLKRHVKEVCTTLHSADGISFDHPKTAIHEMELFSNGWFQVQDEAAQLVSYVLSPQPGELILDACAGLGGKTGHIAQLMNNKGRIVALDQNPDKIARLCLEIKRLGIKIVTPLIRDLTQTPADLPAVFDRILLDAPCSGLGVIRRNPDIKWDPNRQHLMRYHAHQLQLLEAVSKYIKPSGRIVYAVCSLEPEENEWVIQEFIKQHPGFEVLNISEAASLNLGSFVDKSGFFRTLPHRHSMDGFFCACLIRSP